MNCRQVCAGLTTIVVVLSGYLPSDAQTASEQQLYHEAVSLVEKACTAEKTSYTRAEKLYDSALKAVKVILNRYQHTLLAARLAGGRISVGSLSVAQLEAAVAQTKEKAGAEQHPLNCALYLARLVPEPGDMNLMISQVAAILARAGWFHQALESARTITHSDLKVGTLSRIAAEYKNHGHNDQALEVLTEAFGMARWLGSSPFELRELLELAGLYQELGEGEKSLDILALALEAARKPAAPFSRAELLVEIARKYCGAKEDFVSTGLLTEAYDLAKQIENPLFRSRVLSSIAAGYLSTGQPTLAALTMSEALRMAHSGRSPSAVAEIMAEAAAGYAAIGQKDKAIELISGAVQRARTDRVDFARAEALLAAAEICCEIGLFDLALEVIREVEYPQYDLPRRMLLQTVAEQLVRNGYEIRALEIVKEEQVVSRDSVLLAVVAAHIGKGNYDQAYLFTQTMKEAYYRARALTELSRSFSETGMTQRSGHFMLEALDVLKDIERGETADLYRIAVLMEIGLICEKAGLEIGHKEREILHAMLPKPVSSGWEAKIEKLPPGLPPEDLVIKMIIGNRSCRQVGLEFQGQHHVLGKGDEFEDRFKILDIYEFSVKVLDYRSSTERYFVIEPF